MVQAQIQSKEALTGTTTNVSVVPVIDTSYSMTYYGYVPVTVIDSKAFIRYALPGDNIGVVHYDTQGAITYPTTGGSLIGVDPQLNVTQAAASAIQGLSFQGNSTAIGLGIQTARGMLDAATIKPQAMVLLSDGYNNAGPNPLSNLPSYPIYTCAMGSNANIQLMQQIASQTGGQFYSAPYVVNMMQIYNQIRALPVSIQVAVNQLNNIQPQDYQLIPATVSQSISMAQFGIVWTDPSFTYTSGAPGPNQLSITLVTPAGQIYSGAPQVTDPGFVVFNVPTPAVGQWQVQIEYGGSSQVLPCASGVFEFVPAGQQVPIQLNLTAPQKVKAGSPIQLKAELTENGKPIEGQVVHAEVMQPHIGQKTALKMYSDVLKTVQPEQFDLDRGVPEDIAKLMALRNRFLPDRDILPTRKYPVHLQETAEHHYTATVNDTAEVGAYTMRVQVQGVSKSGSPFQRTQLVSVIVE